ncbi:MAG: WD40 repeat domain-containing protein [Thermoleophilaceae bacterium]
MTRGNCSGSSVRPRSTIDLDEPRYFSLDDLSAYTLATLQLRGDERPNNPYERDAVAAPVARRIAELAEPNFLVAGLVARTHGFYDDRAIAADAVTFTPGVAAALDAFLDRLAPIGDVSARAVLTALAFAEAPGFTPELWRLAVHALDGVQVSAAQLKQFAAGSAANFLVESSGGDGSYRLFHQALADVLAAARSQVNDVADDETALTGAFVDYGARTGWREAPGYLFRSLPGHATRAGTIDTLLADIGYVLHADLRRLIPAAAHARTLRGTDTAHLLRMTPRAISADPPERLALLTVTECIDSTATRFHDFSSLAIAPYHGLWASVPRRVERTVLEGHTGWVRAVCAVRVDGRDLLASAADDRTVRIWDPGSGAVERVLEGHTGGVTAVCAVRVDGRDLLASAAADHTVRIWDPGSGAVERVLEGHTGGVNAVCAVRVDGRDLLASAAADRTVRIWDPGSGAVERVLEGHTGWVSAVCAVRVDGRDLLASAAEDRTVRIWDPGSGAVERVLEGHTGVVTAVCAVRVEGRDLLASAADRRHGADLGPGQRRGRAGPGGPHRRG